MASYIPNRWALLKLGLRQREPTVLIFRGSQGTRRRLALEAEHPPIVLRFEPNVAQIADEPAHALRFH